MLLTFCFWFVVAFGCHACVRGTCHSCNARSRLLIEISSIDSFSGVPEHVRMSNLRLQAPIWTVLSYQNKVRADSLLMLQCRSVLNLGIIVINLFVSIIIYSAKFLSLFVQNFVSARKKNQNWWLHIFLASGLLELLFSVASKDDLKYLARHGVSVPALFTCFAPFTYISKYKQQCDLLLVSVLTVSPKQPVKADKLAFDLPRESNAH